MARFKRVIAAFAILSLGAFSLTTPADAAPAPISAHSASYSCPKGGTLAGKMCLTTSSYAATSTTGGSSYSCPTGGTLVGTSCTTTSPYPATHSTNGQTSYSCPTGGTLIGTSCTASSTYAATVTTGSASYTCPSGGTLSGTLCQTTSTYAATVTTGSGSYTCPSGGTLSGTSCITTSSYAATYGQTGSTPTYGYTCPSGGTLSGSTCQTSGSYGATGSYTCPGGGNYNPGQGQCEVFVGQPQTQCLQSGYSWAGGQCYYFTGAGVYAYSCPSGGTLSGSTCNTSASYGATYGVIGTTPQYGYTCNSGETLSGTTCTSTSSYAATASSGGTTYSCNGSDTLSGTTCTFTSSYVATKSAGGTTYSCSGTDTLSGTNCITSTSYAATASAGGSSYVCNSGDTLSGTTCYSSSSIPATKSAGGVSYTCPKGGTLSGTSCKVASTYAATATQKGAYSATSIATDGTVFTATSNVSRASAQDAANREATTYDAAHPTSSTIAATARSVPRLIPLAATVIIHHAPNNAPGTVVATLTGPVATTPSGCSSTERSRFVSAGKTSYTATVDGSGSYDIAAAAPRLPGCYAWSATVTYAGGVKTTTEASVKSSVYVSNAVLATNRLAIPMSGIFVKSITVRTRTALLNQPSSDPNVAIWNAKALTAKTGTVVIAGHVSSTGKSIGVLARAATLKDGGAIYVTTSTGKLTTWIVTNVKTGTSIPTSAFGTGGSHRLLLISCGGAFNAVAKRYTHVVIVSARAG